MGILSQTDDNLTYNYPGMTRFEGVFLLLGALALGGYWVFDGVRADATTTELLKRLAVLLLAVLLSLYTIGLKNLTTEVNIDRELGRVIVRKSLFGSSLITKSYDITGISDVWLKPTHYRGGGPGVYLLLDQKKSRRLAFRKSYFLLTEDENVARDIAARLTALVKPVGLEQDLKEGSPILFHSNDTVKKEIKDRKGRILSADPRGGYDVELDGKAHEKIWIPKLGSKVVRKTSFKVSDPALIAAIREQKGNVPPDSYVTFTEETSPEPTDGFGGPNEHRGKVVAFDKARGYEIRFEDSSGGDSRWISPDMIRGLAAAYEKTSTQQDINPTPSISPVKE